MKNEDLVNFGRFLETALAFWQQSVSEFTMTIWWDAMRPFDLKAVQRAFSQHAINPDTGQFAPKPADVVRILSGRTEDSALLAWSYVTKAVRRVGSYSSVVFVEDPLIHVVISDMGGWIQLGRASLDEWPFLEREFVTRYRGYILRGMCPPYPKVLPGIIEASNCSRGFAIEPPVIIGNPDKPRIELKVDTNADRFMITYQRTQTTPAGSTNKDADQSFTSQDDRQNLSLNKNADDASND